MLKYKLYAYFYISRTNIHYQNYGIMEDNITRNMPPRRKINVMGNYAFGVEG
jgi:hypothetical protein